MRLSVQLEWMDAHVGVQRAGNSLKDYFLSARIWLLHISKPSGREYSFKGVCLGCMLKVQISATHGRGLVTLYGFYNISTQDKGQSRKEAGAEGRTQYTKA